MGVSPSFFFLGRPSSFFFFDGRISPRRPSSAHLFFFWDAHLLHFFLMGVFVRFFLTPRKSKVLVKILFSHFSIFFMGRKLFHAQPVIGGGKFGSWTHFFYFSSKFHFFENLFAHLSPIFFFFGAPIFFKKKRWALFFGAHLSPIFFFLLAHLSPIPIENRY